MIRELPDDYKKTVLIGYFSLILLVISTSMELIFNAMYGTNVGESLKPKNEG